MKFIQKRHFCLCKTHFITPSPCTPVKNVFYSFSLLKYRYEISIVDISTLLKNIDIDMEKWKISISISISIRQFCKISISIKYRIDSNLAYRTGLVKMPTQNLLRLLLLLMLML